VAFRPDVKPARPFLRITLLEMRDRCRRLDVQFGKLQPLLDGQISCFRMRFQRRLFSCDSSIVTVMAASCAEFLMLPLPFVA
jgi:hypothetical protein